MFIYFYQTNIITFHSCLIYSQFRQLKITTCKWGKNWLFHCLVKISIPISQNVFILIVTAHHEFHEFMYIFLIISIQSHSGSYIPSITVPERQITNVYPATGSLRGGTKLTVSGQGFNTLASVNKVKVGSHDCLVESSTSSELRCQIADTGRTHLVTNDGIHPSNSSKFKFYFI